MKLRRPFGRTRAQRAIRGALLVSIASFVAVFSTTARATAPLMRERAPGVRYRTDMPYITAALSDLDIRLLSRMERGYFWASLGVMRDRLETNEEMNIWSSGQPIPVECRLAIALRVLSGASYADVMLDFGVGRSTVVYLLFISGVFCGYTFFPYFFLLIQVVGALDDADELKNVSSSPLCPRASDKANCSGGADAPRSMAVYRFWTGSPSRSSGHGYRMCRAPPDTTTAKFFLPSMSRPQLGPTSRSSFFLVATAGS